MKYRVIIEGLFPAYFRTKREASAYMAEHGGHIQRKLGRGWFDC